MTRSLRACALVLALAPALLPQGLLAQSSGPAEAQSGTADAASVRSLLDAANRDSRLLSEGNQPWRANPSLEERYFAARQQLREVDARLSAAGASPEATLLNALSREAEMAAREMAVLLEISRAGGTEPPASAGVRTGADYVRQKTDLQRKIDYAKAAIDKTTVKRAIVRKEARPAIDNLRAARNRAIAALRGDIDEIRAARIDLGAAIERSDRAMSDSRAAFRTPESLIQAADALFAGEYRRVIDLLDAQTFGNYGKNEAQRHLFIAAAAYSLFQIGGGKDDGLRFQAQQNVREALDADPDLQPSEKAFSPRFIAFFRASGS